MDFFFVSRTAGDLWHAELHTCHRRFEMGVAYHGGFYCREERDRGPASFVPIDAGPLAGPPEKLVPAAITLIRGALDNPLLQEPHPPIL